MTVSQHHLNEIAKFEAATIKVPGHQPAVAFTVVALEFEGQWILVAGRLVRNARIEGWPRAHLMSAKIRAGTYFLDELKMTEREVIEALLNGGLDVPHGRLAFPKSQGDHEAYFIPFHNLGDAENKSVHVLQLAGDQRSNFERYPDLDWAIRAELPGMTFPQFLSNWGFDPRYGALRVDVVELPIATFGAESELRTGKLKLDVHMPHGSDISGVTLNCTVTSEDGFGPFGNFAKDLTWIDLFPDALKGWLRLDVGKASELKATLSYQGRPQQHLTLIDTFSITNAKHVIFQSFDPDFTAVGKIIRKESFSGGQSRELESVVAWLAWMLGFEPLHIGDNKMLQDGPDVVVSAPDGRLAFVEVLSGVDQADRKAHLLAARIARAHRGLNEADFPQSEINGMMVTNRPRAEAERMFGAARELGFCVAFREDLENALAIAQRTKHPARLFDRIFGRRAMPHAPRWTST